ILGQKPHEILCPPGQGGRGGAAQFRQKLAAFAAHPAQFALAGHGDTVFDAVARSGLHCGRRASGDRRYSGRLNLHCCFFAILSAAIRGTTIASGEAGSERVEHTKPDMRSRSSISAMPVPTTTAPRGILFPASVIDTAAASSTATSSGKPPSPAGSKLCI